MLMVLPIASMGMEHRDGAPTERLARDSAVEVIQALCPAAHERAQHSRRVPVENRPEHRRHRQDDVSVDDALMQLMAHLAHPVIDVDLSTP